MRSLISALSFLLAVLAAPAVATAQDLSGRQLLDALLQGGHYIYFRHAATDWSQSDHVAAVGDWRSCDGHKIRQLSDEGRADARRIGAAMRALMIPVARILSSEYCRAVQTAEGFDMGKVETTLDIMNLRAAALVGGHAQVIARFRKLLARSVPKGRNIILVGHGNLLRDATTVYPGEGGSGIFKPDPAAEHGFRLVGRLSAQGWTALADAFGKTR